MEVKHDLPLPANLLPKCWNDDIRMNALYAPIRSAEINPLDRIDKITFWKPVIDTWCFHYRCNTFTFDELKRAFVRNGKSPHCFNVVIEEMLRHKQLIPYLEFTDIPQQSWTLWAVDTFLKRPVLWTMKTVRDTMWPSLFQEDLYVHTATTKAHAESIWSSIDDSHKNLLLELKEVAQICQHVGSMRDLEVSMYWLQKQGKVALSSSKLNGEMLVKFASTLSSKVIVTEMDTAVYALKYNEKVLLKLLENLEREKKLAVEEAKMYVGKDMKHMAKTCLRRKHELEKSITKRSATLDNVQQLLSRVREAESDSKVLESYKIGLAALKMRFKHSGISEEAVSDTMNEIEEMLDVQKEVEETLGRTVGGDNETEEDLEAELAELLELPKRDVSATSSTSTTHIKRVSSTPASQSKSKSFNMSFQPEFSEDEETDDVLESKVKGLSISDLPSPPTSKLQPPKNQINRLSS